MWMIFRVKYENKGRNIYICISIRLHKKLSKCKYVLKIYLSIINRNAYAHTTIKHVCMYENMLCMALHFIIPNTML